MIRTLTLVDFMAHGRTVLELSPGLNVLCGPNNTGKSAVVEALRCLACNPSPRHVIRHGAAEARVEALLDCGHRVAWVRRKHHAIYEIFAPGADEPEVYAKLGKGGVPEDVARLLRLSPVVFEKGQEVDVHLGDQRHPIFLLDQPGSLLADFLASSTESAHLMAMQDLLREKVRLERRAMKGLEEEMAAHEAGLDRLVALPGLNLSLEGLRAEGRSLEAARRREPGLEAARERLDAAQSGVRRALSRARTLESLQEPPAREPSAALSASLAGMAALGGRVEGARELSARLEGLAAPPAFEPSGPLAARLAGLERSGGLLGRAMRRAATLEPLAAPPQAEQAAPLAGAIAELSRGEALRSRASARLAGLAGLAEPPAARDPVPLARLITDMETLAGRVAKGLDYLARREQDMAELAGRIAGRLGELGECPLCGSAMDAEVFLKKAGGHGTSQD